MNRTNKVVKVQEVDYTKTGFNEIKQQLINYIKTHYPDTYKDFNQSSFGSMMLDLVSYVGDQLHYYLDHNANEAILPFTKDAETTVQLLQALGVDPSLNFSGTGMVDVQVLVPSLATGVGIDSDYKITCRAGSKFRSAGGAVFTQISDAILTQENSQILVHSTNEFGNTPEFYIFKTKVPVVSGEEKTFTVEVGDPKRFLKIEIPDPTLTEILRIVDSNGNDYFQVGNLSEDTIYRPIIDPEGRDPNIKAIMKPTPVPRRFITEKSLERTFVVFGNGSESTLTTNNYLEPRRKVMKFTGLDYTSKPSNDPVRLQSNHKLGVSPSNTTLTITYRSNTVENSNAAVGTVNQVVDPILFFDNENLLDQGKVSFIKDNVQVYNEEPINGNISIPSTEELKRRYLGFFGAQGRAVTKQDYISMAYAMPGIYGAVKRASIIRDNNDLRRNLNMFLVAEGADGKLQKPSNLMKQNLKTWLESSKMISDTLDLFDANIINLKIDFKVILNSNSNPNTVISDIKRRIFEELTLIPPDVGEPIYISEIMRIIQTSPDVATVPTRDGVKVSCLSGGSHSDFNYEIDLNTSPDNNYIYIPENSIWEIKFIDDIVGTVVG
tara:strand:- start:65 stop:1885 length:1821 start_codon:yes stop_codon:yes gene_type:complete